MSHYYKVGGSLEYQHPTYVVRQADHDLYTGLKQGEFCYVLNSRQIGKSSLRVQIMKRLREEGFKCAAIDMTRIGSYVTPAEWYGGIVSELIRGFSLSKKVNFSAWWRERELLSPVQRLSEFIQDVLLVEFTEPLVIFMDEIDSILKIEFKSDFFALIRGCYNSRAQYSQYKRLTFCLLGVASPSDLITAKSSSTLFNIGRAIELAGFSFNEARPLEQGLEDKADNPAHVLTEVLFWTGGQPFLTQKLCKLIALSENFISSGFEAQRVEEIVRSRILDSWETQDEPEHLRTVRDRILHSSRYRQLLNIYLQVLISGAAKLGNSPNYLELQLSGLVVKRQDKLYSYNRIYESVFNISWIKRVLQNIAPNDSWVPTDFLFDQNQRNLPPLNVASYPLRSSKVLDQETITNDRLSSGRPIYRPQIDYTRLQELLATGQWQLADQETAAIMLQVTGRAKIGWLRRENLQAFPCSDLSTLDLLWTHYSGGHFGFSIQTRIWLQLGGNPQSTFEVYKAFGKQVGWYTGSPEWYASFAWIAYANVTFNLQALPGHLPILWRRKFEDCSDDWCGGCSSLAIRLSECKLESEPIATHTPSQRLVTPLLQIPGEKFLGELMINQKLIRIYQGDITNLSVDAIVNFSDTELGLKEATGRRLQSVGGYQILLEAHKLAPIAYGTVIETTAAQLQAKKVFHGALFDQYARTLPTQKDLQKIIAICMRMANKNRFQSIAFPLINEPDFFSLKVAWNGLIEQVMKELIIQEQFVREVVIVLNSLEMAQDVAIQPFLSQMSSL